MAIDSKFAELGAGSAFDVLFERSPDGLTLSGRDGRIAEINEAALRMLHLDKSAAVGRTVQELLAGFQITHDPVRPEEQLAIRQTADRIEVIRVSDLKLKKSGDFTMQRWRRQTISTRGIDAGTASAVLDDGGTGGRAAGTTTGPATGRPGEPNIPGQRHVAYSLTDGTGTFVWVSRPHAAMFGYEPGELVGMKISDLTHPDDWKLQRYLYEEVASGERDVYRIEKRQFRKDGSMVWCRVTCWKLAEQDNLPGRTLAIVEDITEDHERQDRINRLHLAFHSQSIGLAVLDSRARPYEINMFMIRRFRLSSGENRPFYEWDAIPPSARTRLADSVVQVLSGKADNVEIDLEFDAGTPARWLGRLNLTSVKSPEETERICVLRVTDITELRSYRA